MYMGLLLWTHWTNVLRFQTAFVPSIFRMYAFTIKTQFCYMDLDSLPLQYRYFFHNAEISYGLIAVLCIQAQEGKTRSIFSMFPGNKPLLVTECL